jgi:hypothetical protein
MEKIEEVEGLRINGISIKDILSKDLIEDFEKENLNINPVSIVFINEDEQDKKKILIPIILGHQNKIEVEKGILHIDSPNEEYLIKIATLIKSRIRQNENTKES